MENILEKSYSTGKFDTTLNVLAAFFKVVLLPVSLEIVVTSSPTATSICKFSNRTYLWSVQTFRLVPDNCIMIQDFRTSVPSVLAGVFHLASQILLGQVYDFRESLSAGRTAVHFRLADVTDFMSI
jgi:hypothetical protein